MRGIVNVVKVVVEIGARELKTISNALQSYKEVLEGSYEYLEPGTERDYCNDEMYRCYRILKDLRHIDPGEHRILRDLEVPSRLQWKYNWRGIVEETLERTDVDKESVNKEVIKWLHAEVSSICDSVGPEGDFREEGGDKELLYSLNTVLNYLIDLEE